MPVLIHHCVSFTKAASQQILGVYQNQPKLVQIKSKFAKVGPSCVRIYVQQRTIIKIETEIEIYASPKVQKYDKLSDISEIS
jgi:hypothetical protein